MLVVFLIVRPLQIYDLWRGRTLAGSFDELTLGIDGGRRIEGGEHVFSSGWEREVVKVVTEEVTAVTDVVETLCDQTWVIRCQEYRSPRTGMLTRTKGTSLGRE